MKISIAGKSDIGLVRTNNEDAFSLCPNLFESHWDHTSTNGFIKDSNWGTVCIVADGMGGANAGEMASSIAINSIKQDFCQENISPIVNSEEAILSFLKTIVVNANNSILQHTETDPDTIGMGTTIVLLWILKDKAYIVWCGDSRCYVFNPLKGLKSLSKDHSYVQELIDKNKLKVKDSYNHPDSSIITRCLGDCDTSANPEIKVYEVKPHDQFLLCSDGLCGYCRDSDIEKVLYSNFFDSKKCCDSLMKLALDAGGQDNITIIYLSTLKDNEEQFHITLPMRIKSLFKKITFL